MCRASACNAASFSRDRLRSFCMSRSNATGGTGGRSAGTKEAYASFPVRLVRTRPDRVDSCFIGIKIFNRNDRY